MNFTLENANEIARHYTLSRAKVVERLSSSFKALENTFFFHSMCISVVVTLIVFIFSQLRSLTLIGFHIIFMILGVMFLLAEGLVVYRNPFLLENLSPIMQFTRKWKIRSIHQTLQVLGSIFILIGFLFVLSEKYESNESLYPTTIHGVFGYIAFVLISLQISSGLEKLEIFRERNVKIKRWHADVGLFLWDLLCFTSLLGLGRLFGFSSHTILTFILVSLLWLSLHVQMKKKLPDFEEDVSSDAISRGLECSELLPKDNINDEEDDDLIGDDFVEVKTASV